MSAQDDTVDVRLLARDYLLAWFEASRADPDVVSEAEDTVLALDRAVDQVDALTHDQTRELIRAMGDVAVDLANALADVARELVAVEVIADGRGRGW